MGYLYSASAGGFYRADVHGDAIPPDAVPITDEAHAALMAGQISGHPIIPGPDGAPMLGELPPPRIIRRLLPLAFRRRLTTGQRQALTLAASAAMDATPPNATLQTFLDDLSAARFVDLDDPETIAGVAAIEAAGVITPEEAAALLADGTADEAAPA
jgi:hypothetical protein